MFAENQRGSIELYSAIGQKVLAYKLKSNEAVRIDLSGIQTGVYFYNVKVNGEIKFSDKLVVVK